MRPGGVPIRSVAIVVLLAIAPARADETLAGIACRSVHLRYPAPEAVAFYNEVTVDRSAEGSYFMACGFDRGYFGIQEQADGRKVALFSVWDPGRQDDPKAVPEERRVKLLSRGDGARIGRFGNEGTGGQSFLDADWKVGETCRFLVAARVEGDRTRFAGYYAEGAGPWRHLATFSTIAGGRPLGGYYSFVEDFRRDRVSATRERVARFGNGWVREKDGHWVALTRARFTADRNPATNINAALVGDAFLLATGGATRNEGATLGSSLDRPPVGVTFPREWSP